ncbi:hypothetical protein AVEN_206784-1 [Araneus ventricosus]|uniref:Uncharacterized protein n=1 Tax=Araneus ventricosus TaxID=182803 RepID=A0A4Y2C4H4_ARAVE|nr:hypothetical protein AVEN_206784-1 [Araneus ventricosus]
MAQIGLFVIPTNFRFLNREEKKERHIKPAILAYRCLYINISAQHSLRLRAIKVGRDGIYAASEEQWDARSYVSGRKRMGRFPNDPQLQQMFCESHKIVGKGSSCGDR